MKQLGIIGLGAMGAPMAGKLQECGFQLFTTVRSAYSRQKAERMGIQVLETAGEIAERTDRILLMVSNYEQCRGCLQGTDGVLAAMKKGIIIVSSTIAPEQMRLLSEMCPEGIALLDAPVSGGVTRCRTGKACNDGSG